MRILLILLFVNLGIGVIAQDEPYYEPVGERDIDNLEFLPNLSTVKNRVYIGTSGGSTFMGSKLQDESRFFVPLKSQQLTWDVFIGFNSADKSYFEFGYSYNPIVLNYALLNNERNGNQFNLSSGGSFPDLQLRYKRKLINIDRVAKKSGLLITAGVGYNYNLDKADLSDRLLQLPIFFSGSNFPDTANYFISPFYNGKRLSYELGFEVSGRLAEQFEIGFYVKTIWRSRGLLSNTLEYQRNSGERLLFLQEIKPLSLSLGVLLKWNTVNWIKYKNKVQ